MWQLHGSPMLVGVVLYNHVCQLHGPPMLVGVVLYNHVCQLHGPPMLVGVVLYNHVCQLHGSPMLVGVVLYNHVCQLHGPRMFVDKTNFGLKIYNHANFYRFEKTSSYWSVKRISVFLCFSLVNQRHTSGITVYNRTVTNIETLYGPRIAAIDGLSCEIQIIFIV